MSEIRNLTQQRGTVFLTSTLFVPKSLLKSMSIEIERSIKPNVGADDMNRLINIESIVEQPNIEAGRITVEDISDYSIEKNWCFN